MDFKRILRILDFIQKQLFSYVHTTVRSELDYAQLSSITHISYKYIIIYNIYSVYKNGYFCIFHIFIKMAFYLKYFETSLEENFTEKNIKKSKIKDN